MASNSNGSGDKPPSSNRLDSKEYQDALKKRKEEADLFNRFKKVATTKLESMANEAKQEGSSTPKYTMGEKEKTIIRNLQNVGLKEGMIATVIAFVTLRRGPIYVARWVQRRKQLARQQQQQQQSSATPPPQPGMTSHPPPPSSYAGGYQLSDPNKVTTANPFTRLRNPEYPRSKSIVIRTVWFMFDSILSLMLGASISMSYTNMDKIRDQIVDLPLVPGRSLVSDALCDEIVKELQKVKKEKDPAYMRLMSQQNKQKSTGTDGFQNDSTSSPSPSAFYLQGIIGFSENCQRRRFVERQIRQEQGLETSAHVEIPEPGVSKHGQRLITNDGNIEGGTDDEFDDLTLWASDMVADNEDDFSSD